MTYCANTIAWIQFLGGDQKTSPASRSQRVKILYVADTWSVPHLAAKAISFAFTTSGEIWWRILSGGQSTAMKGNATGKMNFM